MVMECAIFGDQMLELKIFHGKMTG